MAESLGTAVLELDADGSKLDKGLRDAEKGALSTLERVGGKMKSAGKGLTAGVTLPIVAIGGAAIKASTDLNAMMANVAALGLPAERVNELKKNVQDLSIATGKSTDDLADGLYNVVSAFGDTADTAAILETNAKLAAAGLATTGEAIAVTSAVTKAYGDTSAGAVEHVGNLALKTVELGQTTLPELSGAIGRVTPLANELGVSQEELFGTMAAFTGVTGSASEVSTQLRGVMQALMAPTADTAKLMEDLGYESGEAMMAELGLEGTTRALVQAAEDTGKPLQKFIGSIEGQTLALAGTGEVADAWIEKTGAMGDVAGGVGEGFSAQTEGINAAGFAMQQARAQATVLAQNMGDALAPMLLKVMEAAEPLIAGVQRAVEWFSNLDAGTQSVILTIVAVVAAVGPLLWALGAVIGMLGSTATSLGLVNAAGAPMIGTLLLIVAAVAAVIAIGILVWKNWDKIVAALAAAWEWIKDTAERVWGAIVGAFQRWLSEIKREFQVAWDAIKGALSAVWDGIKAAAEAVWNGIKAYFTAVLDAYKKLFTGAWDAIKAVVTGVWENLKRGAQTVFDVITGIWNLLSGAASRVFNGIRDAIAGAMETAKTWVIDKATALKDGVVEKAEDLLSWVTELPGRILDALGDLGSLLFDAGKKVVQGLIDGIGNMVGKVGDAMSSVTRAITDRLPWSPAKEGPLAIHPPEEGGANIGSMLARGLHNSLPDVSGVLNGALTLNTMRMMADVGTPAGGIEFPQRLKLVVGDREFDAYVDTRADGRVSEGFRELRRGIRAY